jgi:hypothetical protein
MRRDVWEIADTLHTKIPKIVLITSGRRFESDPAILQHIGRKTVSSPMSVSRILGGTTQTAETAAPVFLASSGSIISGS